MNQERVLNDDESFIAYITDNVERMKAQAKLGSHNNLGFFELQKALVEYLDVRLELDGKVNRARLEFQWAKEEFDHWFAEQFVKIRARENRPDLAATKWVGSKELEYMVRAEHAVAYRRQRQSLNDIEMRYEFMKDLKESWDSFRYILSTLSNNVRSEVGLDGMPNRLTR